MVTRISTCCQACKLSFVDKRTNACEKAICKTYALANAAQQNGHRTLIHPEISEWIQKTKPSQGPIKTVAQIASEVKKPRTSSQLTASEAAHAFNELNSELIGPSYSQRVVHTYLDSLTLNDFRRKLIDTLTDPETKTKRFALETLNDMIVERVTFEGLSANAWDAMNSNPLALQIRVENAFKKAEASLEFVTAKLAEGEIPSENLMYGIGPYLLGRFEPYGALNDEERAARITNSWVMRSDEAKFLSSQWNHDGPEILSAISELFLEAIKNQQKGLLEAADTGSREENVADERVIAFLGSLERKRLVDRLVLHNIQRQVAEQYVERLPDVFMRLPYLATAVRAKLVNEYISAATKRLDEIKALLMPTVQARILALRKTEGVVNWDNVRKTIDEFAATPEGEPMRAMSPRERNKVLLALRKHFTELYPEIAARLSEQTIELQWKKIDLRVAVKAIVDDLLTANFDKLKDMGWNDTRAALFSENCYAIAETNGVSAKEYERKVLDNPDRLYFIVNKIKSLIAEWGKLFEAAKGDRLPEVLVRRRETKRNLDAKSLEKRRAKLRNQKEEAERHRIREVQELCREVRQVWTTISVGVPDALVAVKDFRARAAKPPSEGSSTTDQLISAYEKVCENGGTFSEFVRLSQLSDSSTSGTLAHRLAWNILERSRRGSERRLLLVEKQFEAIQIERVTRDYFSLGLPWPPHRRLLDSVELKNKKWNSPKERDDYVVQSIIRGFMNTLAEEAPAELSDKEVALRMLDGSLDTDGAPRSLVSGVMELVARSNRLMEEIEASPDDAAAFLSREEGLKEMKQLLKHAEELRLDISVDAFDIDLETDKGIILARFAEASSTKQSFLDATFAKWRVPPFKKDNPARPRPAGNKGEYLTTYPPYLLRIPFGQKVIEQYAQLYDQLSNALSDPKKRPHEESIQIALKHRREDEEAKLASAYASSPTPDHNIFAESKEEGEEQASKAGPGLTTGDMHGSRHIADDYWLLDEDDGPDYLAWISHQMPDTIMTDVIRNNPTDGLGVTRTDSSKPQLPVQVLPTPAAAAPAATGDKGATTTTSPATTVAPTPATTEGSAATPAPAATQGDASDVVQSKKRTIDIRGTDTKTLVGESLADPLRSVLPNDGPVVGSMSLPPATPAAFEIITDDDEFPM